ncbi:MAG: hypothetical protein ABJN84_16940 [Flavobacteriaceae bacterium]
MKKLIIILLFPLALFSQKKNDSIINSINAKVLELDLKSKELEEIKREITLIKSQYDYQEKTNEKTLDSISNQIGAASYNLTIFGILFGIAALGLGLYVTYIERKIVNLRVENEKLLGKSIRVKDEVVSINEKIQNDIYGLFLKIKREETVSFLNRLCEVPSDITNVATELFSRELLKEDFSVLKKAHLSLLEEVNITHETLERYSMSYYLLFFQHFLDLTIRDEILASGMIDRFATACRSANSKDIVRSTEDFMKAIIDLGFQKHQKEINGFIEGVSDSDHKNFIKIYEIVFDSLGNRDDQFKLYSLIENKDENRPAKVNYGDLLVTKYSESELSESEKTILEDVEKNRIELIESEEKKDKTKKK